MTIPIASIPVTFPLPDKKRSTKLYPRIEQNGKSFGRWTKKNKS